MKGRPASTEATCVSEMLTEFLGWHSQAATSFAAQARDKQQKRQALVGTKVPARSS